MNVPVPTITKRKPDASPVFSDAIDKLVRRLVRGFNPEKIILFGSYAHGTPTPDSDLDVVVVVSESNEPPYRRGQAAYKHVGAIGIPKDLLVFTREEFETQARVATSLARRVQKEGLVLYERGKTNRSLEMVGQEPA